MIRESLRNNGIQMKRYVHREEREVGRQHGLYTQVRDQAEEKVAQIMPQREQAR